MGVILKSFKGFTSMVRLRPGDTAYTLPVLTVVPSTVDWSGISNVPLPLSSTWQFRQLLNFEGKRTELKSLMEVLCSQATTHEPRRNPPRRYRVNHSFEVGRRLGSEVLGSEVTRR